MVQRDIVVIGASAGGVQAMKTLVSGLPSGFPAAVLEERILLLREIPRADPRTGCPCQELRDLRLF